LLDRLTHHVHILEMNGDSYRLKQSKRKQKSQPAPRKSPSQPIGQTPGENGVWSVAEDAILPAYPYCTAIFTGRLLL